MTTTTRKLTADEAILNLAKLIRITTIHATIEKPKNNGQKSEDKTIKDAQ